MRANKDIIAAANQSLTELPHPQFGLRPHALDQRRFKTSASQLAATDYSTDTAPMADTVMLREVLLLVMTI